MEKTELLTLDQFFQDRVTKAPITITLISSVRPHEISRIFEKLHAGTEEAVNVHNRFLPKRSCKTKL